MLFNWFYYCSKRWFVGLVSFLFCNEHNKKYMELGIGDMDGALHKK